MTVTPPTAATASFGITGATESDTCSLSNAGNTLNCTFYGSTSTAPGTIVAWDWTYGVKTTFSQTTTGAVLSNPAVNCDLIPAPPLPAAPADQWFTMIITLKVHDSLGNVGAVVSTRSPSPCPPAGCGTRHAGRTPRPASAPQPGCRLAGGCTTVVTAAANGNFDHA